MSDDEYSFTTGKKQAGTGDRVSFGSDAGWTLAESRNVRVEDGAVVPDAVPGTVVDNFEPAGGDPAGPYEGGQDLSEYYRGTTGEYVRTQSSVEEGGWALAKDNSDNGLLVSQPGDGLPHYPEPGDRIHCIARPVNGNRAQLVFNSPTSGSPSGWSDLDGYVWEFNDDDLRVRRCDGGSWTELKINYSPGTAFGTWYWVETQTPSAENDAIEVEVYELNSGSPPTRGTLVSSVSATDNTYTDRGIGTAETSGGGSGTFLDWIRIET